MYTSYTISPQTFRALNLDVDADGFLVDRRQWSAELAQQLADSAGVGYLTESHWQIIEFVRERYFRLGALPEMNNLCRRMGVKKDAVAKAFGSCQVMWQIAGLPNPGEEARAYMI